MALWQEPIEIMNSGPEFIEGLRELIIESARKFAEKPIAKTEELANLQAHAI
jgi:hypothetical protein